MFFKIENNNIICEEESVVIESIHNSITLAGKFPINSVIECVATCGSYTNKFYLNFVGTHKEYGYMFSQEFITTHTFIKSIARFKTPMKMKFIINNTETNNTVDVYINKNNFIKELSHTHTNDFAIVKKMVNDIYAQVFTKTSGPDFRANYNAIKGMVPVVCDDRGNYRWDFPFKNLEKAVQDLVAVTKQLTDMNTKNVERICLLEEKVDDILSEKYVL